MTVKPLLINARKKNIDSADIGSQQPVFRPGAPVNFASSNELFLHSRKFSVVIEGSDFWCSLFLNSHVAVQDTLMILCKALCE